MSNTDRIGIMERRRALETARNILYSKVGKVVLDENKFPDRILELQAKRLDVESKKNSSLIDNDKKMFKRSRLIYNLEPTILIERPPSPAQKNPDSSKEPVQHYMLPIKRKDVPDDVPEMPPKIDAFTVLKRKTKNIWETKYTDEDMNMKFRSIIMQSPPLNGEELTQLDKGYATYRPASRNEEEAQRRIEEKRKEKIALLREVQRSPSPDAHLVFITQLEKLAERRASKGSRSGLSQGSNKSNKELSFNPFHLERFEKMRAKQKVKFFSKIKMDQL